MELKFMHHNQFHTLNVSSGALTPILIHQYLQQVPYWLQRGREGGGGGGGGQRRGRRQRRNKVSDTTGTLQVYEIPSQYT